MKFEDCKIILYRQDDGSRVAKIPSIPSCYALIETREEALNKSQKNRNFSKES